MTDDLADGHVFSDRLAAIDQLAALAAPREAEPKAPNGMEPE